MTTGRLFLDNLSYFELYALYAKNKPKSDQLMREAGHKFFSSVQVGRIILFVFGLVNVSSVFESVSDFLIGFRRHAIFYSSKYSSLNVYSYFYFKISYFVEHGRFITFID